MTGEFNQCPNGHYYQGPSCPYCKSSHQSGSATSLKTEAFVRGSNEPTLTENPGMTTNSPGESNRTTILDGEQTNIHNAQKNSSRPTRTVFGDEDPDAPLSMGHQPAQASSRYGRKLVGWLVTYSHDELGADFKLYEGRNIIGRDVDCSITVNDGRMSGKHAVLLFRANKYSLTDSQSSHGTFVNDEDIELDPRYLKDGDIIRMGNTIFRFRTSL